MAILGLVSTESVSSQRWTNIRRKVFYQYPNGAAPLTGLLSMMKEDPTNDPEYSWWEKRLKERITTTASQGTSKGPFMRSDGSTDAGDPVDDGSSNGWKIDTSYTIKVASTELFRPGHVIQITVDKNSAASTETIKGIVESIVSTTILKVRALPPAVAQSGGIDNGTTNENVGKEVKVIGSAFAQGVVDLSRESYYLPVNPANYTQIFRTPFSFTGNALVTPVKFDDEGIYKDKAKLHSMDHMIELEMAMLFGKKHKYVPSGDAAPTTGAGLPIYTMGGILYFLELWEAGSTYENTAATSNSDDTKRIITAIGNITPGAYDTYLERIFRSTSNVSNEKLVLCGSGFLKYIHQMYNGLGVLNMDIPEQDTFGMSIVSHKTPFGTIHYKSHPLFSQNSTLRNEALFIDIHNLRYRPMDKRDTQLLKNRQPNDADYRKDEWFTECGLEVRHPESFMMLRGITGYAAS